MDQPALRRFSHGGHAITMEENNVESSGDVDHRRGYKDEIVSKVEKHEAGHVNMPSFPELKDFLSKKDNKLECARAEMNEVRQENHRLRAYLERMTNDYQTLKMKFQDTIQEEAKGYRDKESIQRKEAEEVELFSLNLGRSTCDSRKTNQGVEDKQLENKDLALGLDCKFEASRKFSGEVKEEAAETSPGSKVSNKTTRSVDDEVSQPVKKARVSVRARCDAPTMNDGCQWRKYGQKISKGNPCPRAYYRCTVAPSCPVRKQVQRCSGDMSILITTYEGTHNHPLPMSATAMASTTSAAACMLLSGSTSSQTSLGPSTNITTTSSNLHGLNLYMSNSDNLMSKQFHLPTSSMLSSSPFQTVTLDLTSTPSSSSSSNLNRNFQDLSHSSSRYLPTNLNFNSFSPNTLPWGSSGNGNQIGNTNLGNQTIENIYHSHMHNTKANTSHPSSQILPDTVTKAIATDPNFQSALAAALASIIGTSSSGGNLENLDQKLKLAEAFSIASNSSHVQVHKGNNCASSYLSKTPSSTNLHAGNTTLLPPSFSSSISKNASASPDDHGKNID